ncbi:hypothetical protein QBZ16_000454 [Prototheca wickerhamii]|uniref:Uncharacterized protein n=1 Tax=Prototheca wickerhamii TaxID=3111 RepID=A0AAD9IP26_PROWI|nr:hypothetical protein QBZ16_000454 [Prototheca wickerhamii]
MPVTLFATTSKLHKKLAGEYESQRLERAADIVQRNREELAEALAGLRRYHKNGETIPVSDDEEEDPITVAMQRLAGPQRPRHDYIIQGVTQQMGSSAEVCAAVAACLRLKNGTEAVQERAKELREAAKHCLFPVPSPGAAPQDVDGTVEALHRACCREVAAELARLGTAHRLGSPRKPRRVQRRAPHGGYMKKKRARVTWARVHYDEQLWGAYEPCGCQGPCKPETCPCIQSVNFCEKFCGCNCKTCGNRFEGCSCRAAPGGRCARGTCPCIAASRECDPDLCRACFPTLTGQAAPNDACCNMNLRRRGRKRIVMGLSDVQGWGAFLSGSARKGDHLGEYVGELISHEEAERRGKSYDLDDNSYLFDLNKKWVVDAKSKGRTVRFANHSDAANCQTRIFMVDGDHRIAILAKEDLQDGEEIFYNYSYKKETAPSWAKGKQQRPPGGPSSSHSSANPVGAKAAAPSSDSESDF